MENDDDKPKKRRRAGKRRFTRKPSVAVNMRIPAETWERLEWEAAARNLERPDLIRLILADAVKSTKPPATPNSLVIDASPECREAFAAACALYSPPISPEQAAFLYLLNVCEKKLGSKPVFRNGKWHWKDPRDRSND